MPARTRARIEPTDDWPYLQLQFNWSEQEDYEVVRPVALFGFTLAERARQTGLATSTVYRKVSRFEQLGMRGFLESEEDPDSKRVLPQPIRRAIVQLKAEYPPFRSNELATICHVRFNRRPSALTIKKILATEPPPTVVQRRFSRYAEMEDPQERRGAIVRLHAEGWNIASIAGYLQTSRPTVYTTLKRWIEEGVPGLDDKPLGPKQPVTKTTLWAMNEVRKLQQNPELGEFRIHAALDQLGIKLRPRTCGRILARNRKLYGLRGPEAKPREPKEMPFKAAYRHQYWTADIRYVDVHQLGGGNIYCISILENYSRSMVASAISRSQALPAFLNVLFAALRRYGAPETLISDGGSVFRAGQAMAIYRALGVTHQRIDPGQPWQSYIETNFNVQRRMADWDFSQARSWEELCRAHERWLADFNTQVHWAHQKRTDGRRSPAEVLGWATGKPISEEELKRAFTVRIERSLDQQGYARFRNWRIYGERGLSRKRVVLWLCDEQLRSEFADTPLAEYRVAYRQDHHHLRTIDPTRLYETRHQSPQLPLLELEPQDWRLVIELPLFQRRLQSRDNVVQEPLFPLGETGGSRG